MQCYLVVYNKELYHHGIKGMRWGVRRYQNEDGTLTEAGKKRQQKRTASDREAVITKGTTLYRVSDSGKSDASSGKIYVSGSKESADFYINALGSGKILKTGKAYAHEYVAKTDLKLPDKRTMEKIELGLLKDKTVQRELVDSLMKKGMSREKATEQVAAYNAGKAFLEKMGTTSLAGLIGGIYGAWGGAVTTMNPIGIAAGAAGGAAIVGAAAAASPSMERQRALNIARVSYGDKNNKAINEALRRELTKKGYNAMQDYNDRRAYGDKANQAIIVLDSNKNLKTLRFLKSRPKIMVRPMPETI